MTHRLTAISTFALPASLLVLAAPLALATLAGCAGARQPAQQSAQPTGAETATDPAAADSAGDTANLAAEPGASAGQPVIPRGAAPTIDGALGEGEWAGAASATIEVEDGWEIGVRYMRDADNLYVAFENLKPAEDKELYPEVLIDVQGDGGAAWSADDWWIHMSYSDCEGQGRPNVWQCAKSKDGWSANNFPLQVPGVIEAQISWQKLGLDAAGKRSLGLAFDVTDTRKDYYLWPAGAALDSPETWARVALEP